MLDFVPRDDPPTELMPDPGRLKVQTANAPLLRKLINQVFAQLFAPRKTKQHGTLKYAGLHWWLNMPMSRRKTPPRQLICCVKESSTSQTCGNGSTPCLNKRQVGRKRPLSYLPGQFVLSAKRYGV